jgi:hypothetical protein
MVIDPDWLLNSPTDIITNPFQYQVSGHQGCMNIIEVDSICLERDRLLKPSNNGSAIKLLSKFSPKYGWQECRFYADFHRLHPVLASKWLPKFYGYTIDAAEKPRIMLEDCTSPFRTQPAILDLKIGHVLYDPLVADDRKRKKMIKLAAETTTASLGLRVCGYRFLCEQCGQLVTVNKQPGKEARGISDLILLLRSYFRRTHDSCTAGLVYNEIISNFARMISQLRSDLEPLAATVRLYSTSLLLLCGIDSKTGILRYDLKLIDFAHSYADLRDLQLPDDGIQGALENLSRFFMEFCVPHEN